MTRIVLFADLARTCGGEYAGGPDQGERVFVSELGAALRRRIPTLTYVTGNQAGAQSLNSRLLFPWRLADNIRRERPAVVLYVYPVTAAALIRTRLLRIAAGGAKVVLVAIASHRLGRLGAALAGVVGPDLVLVSSRSEMTELSRLGAGVGLLSPAVDVRRFRPAAAAEKQNLRVKWGLPVDADVVLHVGHLVPARNLEVLAAVAARPNTTAVLVASHVRVPESESIANDLRRQGVVVLDNFMPNVEELYRASDCYLFPSNGWGGGIELPLSVLEAFASDLPVASTFFGALHERFAHAAGVRFGSSTSELVSAVDALLESRPHTRQLVDAFSWDSLAGEILQLAGVSQTTRGDMQRAHAEPGIDARSA